MVILKNIIAIIEFTINNTSCGLFSYLVKNNINRQPITNNPTFKVWCHALYLSDK